MTPNRPDSAKQKDDRAEKRAQALRDNLKRRKEQAKGREDQTKDTKA